ncbi:MAG: type II toxin-antitoxin system antitoxin SocA domain-containing protein [Faecalibacterium sp.]
MTEKTFCEECRNDVEYTTASVPMTGTIKGKAYHYTGTEARCADCGSLVFVPEISDDNLRSLYNVFREENGIVSLDVICAIPEKYDIGKRPLSLLLGWGELTFSRYCDGDIPTRQYSDILQRIYNEPQFYSELLEANKANLKSYRTYEKTRRAVDALLSVDTPSKSKINTVIQYLLYQCEDITPLALQKALYYIQGFHFAFYRTFLFPEDCQAWTHGPVYRDIYFRYRDYRFDPIEKTTTFDASVFSASEKAICDSVINNICCYSGKILERFTHNEAPWLTTRGDLPDSAPSDRIIEKSVIGAYFDAVKAKYNMVNPRDIKDYAQDMFQQL